MADSKSGRPVSHLSFLVTMRLSRLVSEIFACDREMDRRTDNADYYYSCPLPPHRGGRASKSVCDLIYDAVFSGICIGYSAVTVG